MEILELDLLVTMSIEDLTSAFNLIELGDPWMPFQALGMPFPGALAFPLRPEIAHLPWVYPASRVLMMGSKSACGIMQYTHRRILSMRSPLEANFPVEGQIRKDRPFPAWHSQNGKQDYGRIVSMYLDGFTEFELKHWDDLVIGSCGQLQAAMQEAYTQWNVPRQEAKAQSRQIAVEDLGCHIDGAFGAVSTPRQFDVELGAATFMAAITKTALSTKIYRSLQDVGLEKFNFGEKHQAYSRSCGSLSATIASASNPMLHSLRT